MLELADHFQVPAAVCVNKWDLSGELTVAVEALARERRVPVLGRISYDLRVTAAQVAGRSVVEEGGRAAAEIIELWQKLQSGGELHVIPYGLAAAADPVVAEAFARIAAPVVKLAG